MFATSAEEDDPFFSAKLRIARATDHLNDLEAQIDKFFAGTPYTSLVELDPDGIHAIHKIHILHRFPLVWYILATEIVEHLRASLDHATFATRTQPTTNYAAFPFGKTPDDLDNSVRGRSKDVPPEIQALLRSFNAYQGGNDPLYILNELSNASKHGLVTLVAGAAHSGEIVGTAEGIARGIQFLEPLTWDSKKNEIPYARTKRGDHFEHKGTIRVYVALKHPDGVGPIAVTAVLDTMVRECERVVLAIEAESKRIGAPT
jgi:hypothetical protein